MNLKILIPYEVFAEKSGVKRVVARTLQGFVGLLPKRLDCTLALVPGILMYETDNEGVVYVAIDQGVLVKAGGDVLISVRNAIGGTDLGKLHLAVRDQFLRLDDQEQNVRSVLAKMETGFIRRFREFQRV